MIVSLIFCISNPDSLSDLTAFITSSIFSFEIINAVIREAKFEELPDLWIYFIIAASVTYIAAENPNSNKTFLANGVSKCFINGKPAVINSLWKLRNPPSWIVTFLVVPFNKISSIF